jgi:hypothetical protein
MPSDLPPMPDFKAIEAAAPGSADRRTLILALIGNLVFSWSNNESLFIYVLMLLLETDQTSAAIVFATLNTTRARLDLINRLARIKIKDQAMQKELDRIIERFNDCTRVRNEFNHCMYTVDGHGEITHSHSIRIIETKNQLRLGDVKPMDDARLKEMRDTTDDLKRLNRDIWSFMPRLEAHLTGLKATQSRK